MSSNPTDPNLERLARRMVEGKEAAFDEFAGTFGAHFRNFFVRNKGMSWMEAEDLAVSCITDIALKVDRYKPQQNGSFRAWVWTLARNAFVDWCRKNRRDLPLADTLSAPLHTLPDENRRVVSAVQDALALLSDRDREIIQLKFYDQHTFEQIGDLLGIRAGTARTRHFRARRRLKEILERDPRLTHLRERVDSTKGDGNGTKSE